MSRKTTVKVSVSMPKPTFEKADKRAKKLGFQNSFSAYVTKLINDDVERGAVA
jgi:hypothetical protein